MIAIKLGKSCSAGGSRIPGQVHDPLGRTPAGVWAEKGADRNTPETRRRSWRPLVSGR
jgi:hypothetical protein